MSKFVDAASVKTERLVMGTSGMTKEGKTHFALTAPDPIYYLNLDYGIDEIIDKFLSAGKKIYRADFEQTEQTDAGTYGKLLRDFHENYLDALSSAGAAGGTVIVDTATQIWQIVQVVMLDAVLQEQIAAWKRKNPNKEPKEGDVRLMQFHYAKANTYMGGLWRRAVQQTKANVIFTHRAKPRYDESGHIIPGSSVFQGFNETPAIVQFMLRLYSKKEQDDDRGTGFTVYGQIESCRFDKDQEGLVIKWPEFDTFRGMFL